MSSYYDSKDGINVNGKEGLITLNYLFHFVWCSDGRDGDGWTNTTVVSFIVSKKQTHRFKETNIIGRSLDVNKRK